MDTLSYEIGSNDDLMRSLPELARETGIPMPTILRLKREFPEELPSVGAGSQQFFPEGVVPVLRELCSRDVRSPVERVGGRPLQSLAHRRQVRARPPEAGVSAGETPPALERREDERELGPLDARLGVLEGRQVALAAELRELRREVTRPWSAVVGAPLGSSS